MKRIVVCLVVIIGYIIGFNYFIRENSSKNKVLKTEAIEEKQIINDELLTLVNYKNKIPDDWKVNLISLNDQQSIDQRAYQELKNMLNDAKKQGLDIIICSSYRTYDRQKELFVNKIKEYLKAGYGYNEAQEAASMWVAKPNMSEHQLGVAVELVSE